MVTVLHKSFNPIYTLDKKNSANHWVPNVWKRDRNAASNSIQTEYTHKRRKKFFSLPFECRESEVWRLKTDTIKVEEPWCDLYRRPLWIVCFYERSFCTPKKVIFIRISLPFNVPICIDYDNISFSMRVISIRPIGFMHGNVRVLCVLLRY